ncbi:hypothetical protein ACTXT7_013871 [Hymenolepis weldensis]
MNFSTIQSLNSTGNSTEVTDIWEYLINIRGLRRTESELLIPISIIYIIIFTLGFFGNVILLWVILVNRSFHTPINYYLVNLSVSDLLILVLGLPHDLYMMWNRYPYPFEEEICQLRAFLSEASMISSVLTITVLTIESLPITMQVALNYIYRNDSTTNYEKVLIVESSICTISVKSAKDKLLFDC